MTEGRRRRAPQTALRALHRLAAGGTEPGALLSVVQRGLASLGVVSLLQLL